MWTLLTQSLHHLVGWWRWVWPMSPPVWPRPRMCQQCSPPERPHWHCSQSPAGRDWFTGHRPLWQRTLSGAHRSHLPHLHLKAPCPSRGQLFKYLCEVTGHLGAGQGVVREHIAPHTHTNTYSNLTHTSVLWYLAKVSEGREPSSLIFFMHCSCFLRRRLRLVA